MSAEPLPTIRGPYQHYAERSFDWAPIFTARDHDQPTPSYRALEAKYGPPASTIRSHYRRFKAAQANKDDTGLRVALSEIDVRRDNARVFSREEEMALRRVALKENAHPNKPVIQAAALFIHQQKLSQDGPFAATRSQHKPVRPFSAGSAFVQRFKREQGLNDHKPKVTKKYKRRTEPTPELRRDEAAIYMDEVEDAVEKYGGHWTINADEVSAKSFIKPRTLWYEAGGPPPIIPSNHTGKEAFTTIFATTAAGHKLKPAV